MKTIATSLGTLLLATLAGAPAPGSAPGAPPAASDGVPAAADRAGGSPFVDAHTHLDPREPRRSIQAALQGMVRENVARIVFMPPPSTFEDPARYDAEVFLGALRGQEEKLRFLGGGGSLNALVQRAVRDNDAGPEVQRRFRARAEEILRSGAAGFGELAAEHFQGATPYQSAPPDHPLFRLLADIAAEHGVPIDLHMEAVPEAMALPAGLSSPPNPPRLAANVDALERLLAHNPRARIVWAHAGWDNTGYRTPALCRRLLRAHPNLYMDVKVDPANPGKNPPLADGASGALRPEWLELFRDFPERFVLGSDQHYPEPAAGLERAEAVRRLFAALPPELRRKMGMENAARLYFHRQGH